MVLVEGKNILRVGKNIKDKAPAQQLIEEEAFDWIIKVRRGGKFHEIKRPQIKPGDIIAGSVFIESSGKKKPDKERIKIYRGGTTHEIKASEMLSGDVVEYKYRKDELENDNGKAKIKEII